MKPSFLIFSDDSVPRTEWVRGRQVRIISHFLPGCNSAVSTGLGAAHQGTVLQTPDDLAARLGITARSANRILVRLEEVGCITTVGKSSAGKGRPARIMKITLPDSLEQN